MTETDSPLEIIKIEPLDPRGAPVTVSVSRLAFEAGRHTAVIGPNGCGKSTMLEAALGLRADYRREVQLLGHIAEGADRTNLIHVGFAGQRHAFPEGVTARDVFMMQSRMHRTTHPPIFDISGFASQTFNKLSSGQKRRVILCTALNHLPALAILDEPEAGLDEASIRSLMAEIAERRASGTTTIVATHNPDTLDQCENVVVIKAGEVTFHGTRNELIDQKIGAVTIEFAPSGDAGLSDLIDELRALSRAPRVATTREGRIVIFGDHRIKDLLQQHPLAAHAAHSMIRKTGSRDILLAMCDEP